MLGSWRRMKMKSNTFSLRTNRLWIIQPPPTRTTPSTSYIRAIGSALLDRFRVFSRFDDTESAIRPLNPSVTSTSNDDTTFPDSLSKLSIVHCVSATPWTQQTSTSTFQTGTKGVHLTPNDNPELQFWLGSLGVSFKTRFHHQGDLADIENAIVSTERAVKHIFRQRFRYTILVGQLRKLSSDALQTYARSRTFTDRYILSSQGLPCGPRGTS